MKASHYFLLAGVILMATINSCSVSKTMTLNSIELTNQLRPGMSYNEVVEILGNPKSSQVIDDKWVARWNLQEMWKGYIPYDFVFNKETQVLESWSENQKAFEQKQEQLKTITETLEESSNQSGGSNSADANIQNNPELMNSFAGSYYSFSSASMGTSGGTESKVMLCPDGRYLSGSESGYSGGAGTSGAWGSAGQNSGVGTWKISGTMENGVLVMIAKNGNVTRYNFSRCASDCVYFGNTKYAYAGPPECR